MSYDYLTLEYQKIEEKLDAYFKTSYAKEIYLADDDMSYDAISLRNKETKEAFNAIVKLGDIPLGGLVTVKPLIKRSMQGGILNPEELNNIVGLLNATSNIIRYQHDLDNIKCDDETISSYISGLEEPKALKTNITLAISPDSKVLDNASRELMTIRRSLKTLDNRLKMKLNELLTTRASQLTEPLIVQRDGRYCLPVKIEYKNTFKGIVHDISSSNTTAYIEPDVTLEISNQIDSFVAKEKKEIEAVLKGLTLLVAAEGELLLNDLEILTKLDIIFARALFGKENDYSFANVINESKFDLKRAKHPLIDKSECVPIDINLGDKFNVIIITGPNTGGKTVALKTVGLLHIMAYHGLMIPAKDDSTIGMFDSILVDIGDEQSIEQSLSTFSGHMKKIVNILNEVSFNSLVLLDELGSGTDPKEGSSLAISIIEHLLECSARVICTTHYSELKTYAYSKPGILNASVEFNIDTLMPTYKLLLGVPGKSNAIDIAYKLGLSKKIIDRSRLELENSKSESSLLMGNLEEEMNSLRKKEDLLEAKLKEAENKSYQLSKEKIELVKQTDKIINDAKKEASKIISDTKAEANRLIQEIKNMSSIDFKEHELIQLKTKTNNLDNNKYNEEAIFEEEFKEGDYVYVKTYEKYGSIRKISKGKYTVTIGQFDIDFKKNELTHAEKPKEKKKRETKMSGYNPASHAQLSLDLRGKRVEEVDYLMDQYIDQCLLGNLSQCSIIHGFGTGAVRKKVQEYLKNCPSVKSYRYGGEGEGLNGVTIVYFK